MHGFNDNDLFGNKLFSRIKGRFRGRVGIGKGTMFLGKDRVDLYDETTQKNKTVRYSDIADIKKTETGINITSVYGEEMTFDSFDEETPAVISKIKEVAAQHKDTDSDSDEFERDSSDHYSPSEPLKRSSSLPDMREVQHEPIKLDDDDDLFYSAMQDFSQLSLYIRQHKFEEDIQSQKQKQRPELPKVVDARRASISKSMKLLNSISEKASDEEMAKSWEKVKDDKSLKQVAVEPTSLPIPFDKFFQAFWSGTASHPLFTYQETVIKDEDIETMEWMHTDGQSLARTIEYMHPSTAPMGPPMAKTTKEQLLQTFGKLGMVLQTTTIVQGVPMADCFVLEDRILVQPDDDGASTRIWCMYNIKFVQSTMWRRVIETNASAGITTWLQGYLKYLQEHAELIQLSSIQE